jgi:hypothetical protein
VLATTHAPPLPRDPGGQTVQSPFQQRGGGFNAVCSIGSRFLKGWKNERPFLSDSLLAEESLDADPCPAEDVLETCELVELWLAEELDELNPPELCEVLELEDALALAVLFAQDLCETRRMAERNKMNAATKPESRIKHLLKPEASRPKC